MLRSALALALFVAACSSKDADPPIGEGIEADGGSGGGGGGGAGDEGDRGGDQGGGGGGGGDDDGEPDPFPTCYLSCVTAADCDQGNALASADNYSCEDGACIYRGCNSTEECVAAFSSTDYACGTAPGYFLPACLKVCATPTDCALAAEPTPWGADNFTCAGGLCAYTGCHDDAECVAVGPYGCQANVGGLSFCSVRCTTPADCATTSSQFDADNYACEDGLCRYTGCNDDGECSDALMGPTATCRAL